MKNFVFLVLIIFLFSCVVNKEKVELNFLDEYILADSLSFSNTIIGGLSGLDFTNNQYYFVVDDARNPRILIGNINIENDKILNVGFSKVVLLNDTLSKFYSQNILDLESVFMDEKTEEIYLVSEGSINKEKLPTVFKTDKNGKFLESFELPKNLSNLHTIKHNAVFEGSSKSFDSKGFWVTMEAPLKVDGEEPSFKKQSSPIRITYFDKSSKKATKQFAYQLEHISKPSSGSINLNGVTAILEFKENHFFVLERAYQNEFGSYGNTIRIFEAIIDEATTNILEIDSLKSTKFKTLNKRLLLDFDVIKNKLTDKIIDNIEGITFGPTLSNGNKSLILISDDNFQIYGKQLNQFILLEIKENK